MYATALSSNHLIYDTHFTLRLIMKCSPTESFAARARAIFTVRKKRRKNKKIKCRKTEFLNIKNVITANKRKHSVIMPCNTFVYIIYLKFSCSSEPSNLTS